MTTTKRTATEASAVAATAVAVTLAFSGAYIAAGVAALIGVALFVLYERFNLTTLDVSEDDVEFASEEIAEITKEEVQKLEAERDN